MVILLWGAELAAVLNEKYEATAAAGTKQAPPPAVKPL
jgi:hypothetical protein